MHIYEKDGKEYPSVTTILGCLGSIEIVRWANHLGYMHQNYDTVLDGFAVKGTKVHDYLRAVVEPSYSPTEEFKDDLERYQIESIVDRFRRFIAQYRYDTILTEKTIISESLGYAGTCDWVANMYTKKKKYLMLNDFKTSKQVRIKMLLQLGGYSPLLREIGYDIDGASIILANDKSCSMFPINRTELEYYEKAFEKIKEYYLFTYNKVISPDKELLSGLTNS